MLFIGFKSGDNWYALEARKAVAVTPRVALQPCPGTPAYVAGLFRYRRTCIPVLDFCQLVNGTPCASNLGSRILLVPYASRAGRERLLGLMAEAMTEIIQKNESDFNQPAVATAMLPCLGPSAIDDRGIIRKVELEKLLTSDLANLLFNEPGSA